MDLEFSVADGIAEMRLNRPEQLNALTRDMADEMAAHCREINRRKDVRALLVTASGRGFCSGADLKPIGPRDRSAAGVRLTYPVYQDAIRGLRDLDKPVICAVRGPCVGVGWSIALASDYLICSDTAKFAMIFISRGRTPDGGSVHFLLRQVGEFKAKDILLTGRFVLADEAERLGLVTKKVSDAELDEVARAQARAFADGPTYSIALTKQMLNDRGSFERFMGEELLAITLTAQTADPDEGAAAWREKRPPKFTGT